MRPLVTLLRLPPIAWIPVSIFAQWVLPGGAVEYYTTTGGLVAAVLMLWRALEKSRDRNESLIKELLAHAATLDETAKAIDRMRTETHAELRSTREEIQSSLRSCEQWLSSSRCSFEGEKRMT